jgi:hypothetical protein
MNSRHAKASKWYGLQHTWSYYKTVLSRIISQIKLINVNRLATYAKHAKVTHTIYEITYCHDYKIVNAIQESSTVTMTSSHVLRLSSENKPHPCPRVLWRFELIVTLQGKITWQHDTREPWRQMNGHLSLWLSKSQTGLYLTLVLSSTWKPHRVVRGWPEHYPI